VIFHASSNTFTTSSGNGPFSKSARFDSRWPIEEAPMRMLSPLEASRREWWETQRRAICERTTILA
jgi:hypothetical protein